MSTLVFGAGTHGRLVAQLLCETGRTVAGFSDMSQTGDDIIGPDSETRAYMETHPEVNAGFVGVGDASMKARRRLYALIEELAIEPEPLLHPRAYVSPTASVGKGSVVMPCAVVNHNARIAPNVVCYSGSIVEHDSTIGAHSLVCPGTVICGSVTIGESVMVGANATVLPGIQIGAGAMIGAGAVVLRDVPENTTVMGVPAKARA